MGIVVSNHVLKKTYYQALKKRSRFSCLGVTSSKKKMRFKPKKIFTFILSNNVFKKSLKTDVKIIVNM